MSQPSSSSVAGRRQLTAAEAAARLGVKRQTLYAYVSRGLLHREVAIDGRTSLFDVDEIDGFRSRREPAADGELGTVIATELTRVADDGLWIRGIDLIEVVGGGASYEDVVALLWDTPEGEHWTADEATAEVARSIQPGLPPGASGMDRLRAAVVAVSAGDPMRHDLGDKAVRLAGRSLIAAMAEALPARTKPPTGSISARLWSALAPGRGSAKQRASLDAALALLVDHGLASSTLATRVAASSRADPYSAVLSGLGVLGGTLHGAASAAVHDLYLAAERTDAASALGAVSRRSQIAPGFGHTVYRTQDPRYAALMVRVVDTWADDPRLAVVHRIRDLVGERSDAVANVDLALGALTYLARMEPDAGEVIFAVSRTAGWLAHASEEYRETALRFRPRARYVGPRPE